MNQNSPILVMIQGDTPGRTWKLKHTRVTTIGRSNRNVVLLQDPAVSRFHCEIVVSNGVWYLTDLKSRRGTHLNGRKLKGKESLQFGDVIRISKNLLRFTHPDELGEIAEDPDDLRENGIDVLYEQALKKSREREDVRGKGKWLENFFESARLLAKGTVLPLLTLAVCFVLSVAVITSAGVLRDWRAGRIERREAEVKDAFESVVQRFEDPDYELDRPEALAQLAYITREYRGYPEAEEAAAKFTEIEAGYFQHGMKIVNGFLLQGDYESAIEKLKRMDDIIIRRDFRGRIRADLDMLSGMAGDD